MSPKQEVQGRREMNWREGFSNDQEQKYDLKGGREFKLNVNIFGSGHTTN